MAAEVSPKGAAKRRGPTAPSGSSRAKHRPHELRPAKEGEPIRELSPKRWFITDPCGIFTIILVYFFICWPVYYVPFVLSRSWSIYARIPVSIFFTMTALFAIWSHMKCMTTNPGTVPFRCKSVDYPLHDETLLAESEGMRYCFRCDGPKPPKAHHCSTCNRCILKMDHHCPWMNNCIGMYNIKHFALFLFYVCLMSILSICSIGGTLATCTSSSPASSLRGLNADISINQYSSPALESIDLERLRRLQFDIPPVDDGIIDELSTKFRTTQSPLGSILGRGRRRKSARSPRSAIPREVCGLEPYNVLLSVLLGLESLLFGLFTLVMLIDVFQMASSGASQIDEMNHRNDRLLPHQEKLQQLKDEENRTFKLGMQEFCGSKFSVKWSLPLRGKDEYYFYGLTECDRYVLSTTYWDRYVVPRERSVRGIEMGQVRSGTQSSPSPDKGSRAGRDTT